MKLDINCDLGESFGAYTIGGDAEVIPFITSANIACGYHAGDACVMAKTVAAAKANNVACGAHPGYPDLMGFGRRELKASPAEVKAYMIYQLGALEAFCKAEGVKMQHVKPHGAMYNMAAKDEALAQAIVEAIVAVDKDLILLALSGSKMIEAAKSAGIRYASEVFADRAYEEDGTLVARSKPGSMITDENLAIDRVIRMAKEGKVTAITGKDVSIKADSVCVHGDGAKALEFVKKISARLKEEGITAAPLSEIA